MTDDELVAVLAALGHRVRLGLWQTLLPHGTTGLSAGTLAETAAILPSSLSFHLRLMTQARVLVARRTRQSRIYCANMVIVPAVMAALAPERCRYTGLTTAAG